MAIDEDVRGIQLSTKDRCDKCGAQAYVMALLPGGGTLYFCNHHAEKVAAGLAGAGATIYRDSNLTAGLNASRLVDSE